MSGAQETELIFIPLTMISHVTSSFQVATLLTERDKTLTITFLVMKLPMDDPKVSLFIKNYSSNNPRISFVEIEQDKSILRKLMDKDPKNIIRGLIKSHAGPVRDHVAEKMKAHKSRNKIGGFVIDLLCTDMVDVADEFNIPAYVFFPCSSSGLGLLFHLQTFAENHKNKNLKQYEDSDFEVSVPTYLDPVPARVWPDVFFEEDAACFLDMAKGFRKAKGIIVNTFLELENRAIKSLSDDVEIPPVYPIGPILHLEREEYKEKHKEIVSWLDKQPDSSVVYVCFGSAGFLEPDQVKEIATALENSGHRFLWSLRNPPPNKENIKNPRDVLPLGFLDRTNGIGKIIGWAPQMTVLSHGAVGGFVSHCGWNSTLESIWCGVPMAALPLFAEQQLNAFQLVKEFGIAVEIKMDYKRDGNLIVGSDKIERAVRELMDSENYEIRVKVRDLKKKSRLAAVEGGSSYEFLGKWIDDLMNKCNSS